MTQTTDNQELEEQLMAAADDAKALEKLLDQLKSLDELEKSARELFSDNLELLISSPDAVLNDDSRRQLAFALMQHGVDNMLLRDCLAALSRQRFSDFPDPAGLIQALGVLDQSVSIQDVFDRFNLFAELEQGALCWHDSYGLGKVTEIDPFADVIKVKFSTSQIFTLEQFLQHSSLAHKEGLASQIYNKEYNFDKKSDPVAFCDDLAKAFVPALQSTRQVVEKLLVPDVLGPKELISWLDKSSTNTEAKKDGKDKTVTSSIPGPDDEITWENSRSLQELLTHIENKKSLDVTEAHLPNFERIYSFAAQRPNYNIEFAQTLSLVWKLAKDKSLIETMVQNLPDCQIWSDQEQFSESVIDLAGKLTESWLQVSYKANDTDWLIENIVILPLKYWSYAEKVMKENDLDTELLVDKILEKVSNREAIADAIVWLWKDGNPKGERVLSNPRQIFNVLSHDVKGEYIKARKTLFEMVMDNEKFQAALMEGGSEKGIETFVKTVKGLRLLDRGEQQSLLVKIVRQFPQARPFVEERKTPTVKKDTRKMSSIGSVISRQTELKQIINEKIPANSAAIAQARSYGDLRENFEFKAAKDEQRLLMARRSELQALLSEIVATDFSEVEAGDIVIPGLAVELDVDGETRQYYILGLWDSDPDRNILSNDTPLGKAMIGKRVGDNVEFPQGEKGTITAIRDLPDEIKEWIETAH